jgi:hypothetical protein
MNKIATAWLLRLFPVTPWLYHTNSQTEGGGLVTYVAQTRISLYEVYRIHYKHNKVFCKTRIGYTRRRILVGALKMTCIIRCEINHS